VRERSGNACGRAAAGYGESVRASGYLIVRVTEALLRDYSPPDGRYDLLRQLREATSLLEVANYRGMGRWPLDPYHSLDPAAIDAFRGAGLDMDSDKAARMKAVELDADSPDDQLFGAYRHASEVAALLDAPSKWEVIHVSNAEMQPTPDTVGYDIGWMGSAQKYSLISDSLVAPTWHPPQPEDFEELAKESVRLNDHLLFDAPEDALAFKDYYISKPWAETEDPVFEVVRVSTT
jgi:hypothetical protein